MIDSALSDEQLSLAQSLAAVVARHEAAGALVASLDLWRSLGEVGIFGLCSPDYGGVPLDLVAGMEALGAVCCPGPLVATSAASLLLTGDDFDAVVAGERVVTLTDGRLVPWAAHADLVLELAADGAWIVEPEDLAPIGTLSGEPWSVGRTTRVRRLGDAERAAALAELALAAYLLGAGVELVGRAAEHARLRVQFDRPIGEFQAVAHPLARSHAELRATQELVRLLARSAARDRVELPLVVQARSEAARVARIAGDRVHQVFGAMGFALETGIAAATTRVRQWAVLPVVAGPARPPG